MVVVLRSLRSRFVVVLVAILGFVGAAGFWLLLEWFGRSEQEVVQRVNRALAANLVGEDVLLVDGEVNEAALEQVFHTLMVINPSIEVYLLDMQGRLVQHSAPPGSIERRTVDVGPIRAFLEGDGELPIVGDNPRDGDRPTVFSVSPIMVEDRYEGYLYVVLGSQASESVVQRLRTNQILRSAVGVGAGVLGVALVAGVVLSGFITRRLGMLTDAVQRFRASDFTDPESARWLRSGDGPADDEVGRLEEAFDGMAERIIQQLRSLRETDELRRELVANVSHDLKTPLASLRGYLETLSLKQDSLDDERRRRYLEVATRQSERLGHLVEELFELARLQSKEVRPTLEPFPLAELVQDVVQEFRLEAERRDVDLRFDPPEEVPLVSADIGLIQRVLQNLIGNALEHTEAGGSVAVVLDPGERTVGVRVEDTGCGIPAEELGRVFDRFYRADARREPDRRRVGGLGLAIVKRILELHGTGVEAASRVGEGSVFRFSLPVVP